MKKNGGNKKTEKGVASSNKKGNYKSNINNPLTKKGQQIVPRKFCKRGH